MFEDVAQYKQSMLKNT